MQLTLCATVALLASALRPVPHAELCVTSGFLQPSTPQMLAVHTPRMRAVLRYATPPVAELRFIYQGPADALYAFTSGLLRQQIGLKLSAADPCNLIYVMWRIVPEPGIVVSLKTNPAQHRSRSCGNVGYRNLRPLRQALPPAIVAGQTHRLRAEMMGSVLTVRADNREVWHGPLGEDAYTLRGPVGVRTDNARFDLQLLAAPPPLHAPRQGENLCHAMGVDDVETP